MLPQEVKPAYFRYPCPIYVVFYHWLHVIIKNMKKILFLDLDNTLLDSDKQISSANHDAIRHIIHRGNMVVACSGRPLNGFLPILDGLHLNREGCYAIANNGGQIYDCFHKKNLFKKTLTMEEVRYIFKEADTRHLHCQTYDSDFLMLRKLDEEAEFYLKGTLCKPKIVPSLPDGMTEEPIKLLLVELHDHARLDQFRIEMEPWARGRVSLFWSSPYYMEVVREGVSKGAAVKLLCEMLKIPIENSIGAGDSENDIPMLKACHLGCAMSNATVACKSAADYITENDCNHSGVAEIITKFIPD